MSTQQKRLRASIQRIAREDAQLSKVLDAYANRGGFGAAVGSAQSDAEDSRLCCDGSTGDPNPGTSERDPDSSTQSGLDPDDPAKLTNGEGSLTGLTDCATGEPVCMDGDGFIPPDGWDAPDEPPIYPTYDEGRYFIQVGNAFGGFEQPGTESPSATQTLEKIKASLDQNQYGDRTLKFTYSQTLDNGNDIYYWDSFETPGSAPEGYMEQKPCSGSSADYCNPNEEDLIQDQWPADGCVNLAVKSGAIVGSKYDPDQSGSYSVPMDSISLCDNSNGKSILYQPIAGGGWRTIESSGGVAVTGAVGYTYSSDGTQTGTITQAEWDATAP